METRIYEVFFKNGVRKKYSDVVKASLNVNPGTNVANEFVIEMKDGNGGFCNAIINMSEVKEYREYKDYMSYAQYQDADYTPMVSLVPKWYDILFKVFTVFALAIAVFMLLAAILN